MEENMREANNKWLLEVGIIMFIVVLCVMGMNSGRNDPMEGYDTSHDPGPADYSQYIAQYEHVGKQIYKVQCGEPLQGIGFDGVKFGRAFGPYVNVAFYRGDVEDDKSTLRITFPYCHYPDESVTKTETKYVTIIGPAGHEREYGNITLPMGWGNKTLHVLDEVSCDDSYEGLTNGFIIYTVDPPAQQQKK
jgi:hypothetical protein